MRIDRKTARRRAARQPVFEPLEGRALMSAGLDQSFGVNGQIVGNFGSPQSGGSPGDIADAVVVQPDGKIVVVGEHPAAKVDELVVARYDVDGTLDPTFGSAGVAVVYGGNSTDFVFGSVAHSILIQPDGKIVVAAKTFGSIGGGNGTVSVFRLDSDGLLDPTFGQSGNFNSPSLGSAAMALQPNGKIVLVGESAGDFLATRIDADGGLDPTFGTAGVATVPTPLVNPDPMYQPNPSAQADAVAVQPNGKIILGGSSIPYTVGSLYPTGEGEALRLDANGALDTSFGKQGFVDAPVTTVSSVAVQADGKVDLAGGYMANLAFSVNYNYQVVQVNPDGSTVSSYNGVIASLSTQDPVGLRTYGPIAEALALDPEGRAVTVGDGIAFNIARLTTQGNLDNSFTPGGIMTVTPTDYTSYPDEANPAALAIEPDGKIVVVSTGFNENDDTGTGFTLTRISPGGQTPGDYLGTGQSDAAIELPTLGDVAIRPSNGGADIIVPFGIAGAGNTLPAPGDYDGSGKTEIGAYLPSLGEFAYRPSGGGPDVLIPFGIAGTGQTIPAPADYDGTGQSDIAAYLPSLGEYAIRPPTGPDQLIPFGIAGNGQSIPVPGDYEGTGKDDIAVYLPSIGAYAIRPSTGGADEIIPFGIAGAGQSIPVPGDYDGSGKTELAVYLPSLGEFAYRPANGGPDVLTPFGIAGAGQSLPMPGDYDGSGKTELAVYLPSLGDFAYRPSSGPDVIEPFGIAGQTIPFTTDPASNTLPATVSAASVSAEAVGWLDVVPADPKQKKAPGSMAFTSASDVG